MRLQRLPGDGGGSIFGGGGTEPTPAAVQLESTGARSPARGCEKLLWEPGPPAGVRPQTARACGPEGPPAGVPALWPGPPAGVRPPALGPCGIGNPCRALRRAVLLPSTAKTVSFGPEDKPPSGPLWAGRGEFFLKIDFPGHDVDKKHGTWTEAVASNDAVAAAEYPLGEKTICWGLDRCKRPWLRIATQGTGDPDTCWGEGFLLLVSTARG